jgi:hypothetical protein
MFIEPVVAGKALQYAYEAYKNRNAILTFAKNLAFWARHGYLRVSVFGAGGTGKSYLAELLEDGNIDPEFFSKAYEESLFPETRKLGGLNDGIWGNVIVPPGQKRRAESYWHEEYEALRDGKSTGIINVVSWGHHAFGDLSYKDTKYYQPGMSIPKFLKAYAEERRQIELAALGEIVPRIIDADNKKRIWMITLVTKQDLWWNERNLVRDFYTTGTYNNYIEQIRQSRGHQHFIHEYLSASLVTRNFTTGAGEILASTTPGYDQSLQYAHLNRLLETISNFAKL